jgi:hypothetical protein
MDRREFMTAMAGGVAAAQIPDKSRLFAATSPAPLPRAQWLQHGLIDAGGTHEPYSFVVRRGGQRLDAYQQFERNQSEALIHRLKEQGVEVFHTHLYKGFGMAAEMPEMQQTRRTAEIAHRYGMKVDTYIQWNTMMYETFFAEQPRAKDWIQRDICGQPILLTYGYQQSYRYRPCFANQEYLDYLKQIVRFAVEEVKTDFIHFDNFDLNPEPDSCHCPACEQGFRNFLRAKYSPELRRTRFGFEDVDFVNSPQWNRQNRPEKMEIIFDPAIQEWIDYRCQLMADALRQMALYAKSLNPEVAIEINPHGITGGNRAWENGIDHARLLPSTEVFWTEEENPPGYHADGRLISKIRSFKLARAFHNILLTYISNDPVAMAECLAFNQTLGYVGEEPLTPEMLKYLAFYRKHRDLFVGSGDLATVAVLRSYPSLTYHHARAQLSAILVEQTLIQARIPFALVFDEHLNDLSPYRVLVLPDSECLSDQQLAAIRRFVEDGGGLVALGQAGLYDQWRRLRVSPGLNGMVDSQPAARDYEESVETVTPRAGPAARKTFGKGRVVYFSGAEFDGPLPEPEPYFGIDNRFWKRPKNAAEIVEGIRWAAKDEIPLEVNGPEFLVANLVELEEPRRRILHLVNYKAGETPRLQAVEVKCLLPGGLHRREVKLHSPDEETSRDLDWKLRGSEVSFVVPEVKTYAVVAITG